MRSRRLRGNLRPESPTHAPPAGVMRATRYGAQRCSTRAPSLLWVLWACGRSRHLAPRRLGCRRLTNSPRRLECRILANSPRRLECRILANSPRRLECRILANSPRRLECRILANSPRRLECWILAAKAGVPLLADSPRRLECRCSPTRRGGWSAVARQLAAEAGVRDTRNLLAAEAGVPLLAYSPRGLERRLAAEVREPYTRRVTPRCDHVNVKISNDSAPSMAMVIRFIYVFVA